MAGRLFKPVCEVSLMGQEIGDAILAGLGTPQARVAFRVRRTLTTAPDECEIEIYGLAPERRSAMAAVWSELAFGQLELRVGYDGVVSRLFRGGVRGLRVPPVDAAPVVAIADDGGEQIAGAPVRVSGVGFKPDDLVRAALKAMNTPTAPLRPVEHISEHPSVAAVLATKNPGAGVVVVSAGKAADLLDEVARFVGGRWWVQDGLLYMARQGLPVDGFAVKVPRTHYLAEPTEEESGLRVATLLDPRIVPGRQILLEGRVDPWTREALRVESADYRGDTEGSDPWSVSCATIRV